MFGREDRDLGIGIDHAQHPAEVVQVGVGVDDGRYGAVAPVLAVQRECRRCDLLGDQRVDDDDAVVAFHQGHVGHVEAADLVDPVGHLVQAVLGRQLGLPPQAGINGVRAGAVEETPGVHVPDHAVIRSLDDHRLQRADKAAIGIGEVSAVAEVSSAGCRHLVPSWSARRPQLHAGSGRARSPHPPRVSWRSRWMSAGPQLTGFGCCALSLVRMTRTGFRAVRLYVLIAAWPRSPPAGT